MAETRPPVPTAHYGALARFCQTYPRKANGYHRTGSYPARDDCTTPGQNPLAPRQRAVRQADFELACRHRLAATATPPESTVWHYERSGCDAPECRAI